MNILFAEGSKCKCTQLPDETVKDLALDDIIVRIALGVYDKATLRAIMTQLPDDPEDIKYRQEIFSDMEKNEGLREDLEEILPKIQTMRDFAGAKRAVRDNDNALFTLLSDLRSLSVYVDTARFLNDHLDKYELTSRALLALKAQVKELTNAKEFAEAEEDIKVILEDLSKVQSALISVNFNPDLSISEVSAVEFLPYPTRSKYKFVQMAAMFGPIIQAGQGGQALSRNFGGNGGKYDDPLLAAIAPKLEKHLKKHFSDIKQILSKYTKMDSRFLTEMYEGLTFYVALSRFAASLKKADYVLCMPKIFEDENRSFAVKELYNLRLAILKKQDIVKNDFSFSKKENMFILTGPNRGGKTIIEQAIGQVSVMASMGFFVTATSCEGIPFRNILTHFPIDENLTMNYGRLGEEAKRVLSIVQKADDRTLVLFNETYSTTSESDAYYLSEDLLHILKEKGAAVIFNTHIHALAKNVDEMNAWDGESSVVSIVMEIKDNVNTFRLKRSPPDTTSYAKNIALKYGVTYEQMKQK